MKKFIAGIRKKFPNAQTKNIESAFVSAYCIQHSLDLEKTNEVNKLLCQNDFGDISEYIINSISLSSLDDLVMAFEFLVVDSDKKNKGVVYTPPVIRKFITSEVIKKDTIPTVIDPACGCGAFMISVAQLLHIKYYVSYKDIFEKYLWGCDIDSHSVDKCKVLLEILALQNNEYIKECNYNLIVGNALEKFSQKKYKGKYDVVVGNPPYVRSKNIDDKIKPSLKKWSVVSGNIDLYIPFFQLGFELLNDEGHLGYISPNTYLQSVNGRGLRNYIRDQERKVRIINFRDYQRFADVTHYTCLTFIDKKNKVGKIDYSICEDSLDTCNYTSYDISNYPDNMEWRFGNSEIDHNVYVIEHQPDKLDNYNIRNGLATLCNELYFFKALKEDEKYYYRLFNGREYKIEKDICIDIAKPNIMRTEKDLLTKSEKAIFPYKNGEIISEEKLKYGFPCAYQFLYEYKNILLNRDKGKTDGYPEWYAYGRTQGMRNQGAKILIPYMADRGVAIISEEPNLLFYCGYAVFSDDHTVLEKLKLFIESDVFWFYIKMTSKPYSKGFMALAKNYIKNFGIPSISNSELDRIKKLSSEDREKEIAKLYNVNYEIIEYYIHKPNR